MRLLLFVMLSVGMLATSCSKKKSTVAMRSVQQNNNLDSAVGMTAKIGTLNWSTDSVYAYRIQYGGNSSMTDLYISGSMRINDTPSTISFTIVDYKGPDNYIISPPQVSATYYVGNDRHFATLGAINITADSPYAVVGRFNFTADTVIVSEGTFNVAKP